MSITRVYLLMITVGLFPIALSYGVDPASTLPKLFGFPVEAPNRDATLQGLYVPLSRHVPVLRSRGL